MVVTSLPYLRRRFFEVFMYSHFAFVIFFLYGYYHTPEKFAPYLYAAAALYLLDKMLRAVWGLLPRRTVTVDVGHKGVVKLEFAKDPIGRRAGRYSPGQYVSRYLLFLVCLGSGHHVVPVPSLPSILPSPLPADARCSLTCPRCRCWSGTRSR